MNRILSAIRNVFRRNRVERDLDSEVRSFTSLLEEEKMSRGINPGEARRLARLDISGPEQLKEEIRSARAGSWLEGLWRDVIFGARVLRKNPGFTAIAILTLALGIGANSAIFSILQAQLWRPLPFPGSERLVDVSSVRRVNQNSREARSDRVFRAWQQQSRSFSCLTVWGYPAWRNLTAGGTSERIRVMRAASNFFDTLQVPLQRGRAFSPQEELSGQGQVAILTDALWRNRFASDPQILGKSIVLDGQPYTIVGISSANLRFEVISEPAAFVPLTIDSSVDFLRGTDTLGRLAPGVTEQQAGAELTPILQRELKADGDTRDDVVRVTKLREEYTGFSTGSLYFYAGAVALVLLIACVNTAGLTLARGLARRREFALRGALGATRPTLIRQLLVESLLLSLAGGAAGILTGSWLSRALGLMFNEDSLPRSARASLDPRVVLFIFGVSVLSAVAIGLAPALFASRADLNEVLRQGARGASSSRNQRTARSALVVAEVALGLVLLFGAGIFLGSFERQREAPRGFDAPNTLTFRVSLRGDRYAQPAQSQRYFETLADQLRALPGVHEVTIGNGLPLTGTTDFYSTVNISGRPPLDENGVFVIIHPVAPNYFDALHMRLVEGRGFDSHDVQGSVRVAIINRNAVKEIFGDEDPLGKVLEPVAQPKRGIPPEPPLQIVGVVENANEFGANEVPFSNVYLPFAQRPVTANYVAITSNLPAGSLLDSARAAAYALDKDQPIYDVQTMDDREALSVQGAKNDVFLIGSLALVGLALVSVGVFGTIAYFVQQRTQEFGIRLALGAQPATILRHSLGQSLGIG
ncbi:MAG TPA: ABC transporter permease, partial [Candidatus Acidoferrales bacterium]|nr:ABC transporter permease [Candidatus Acidoferrales bacterium]